MVVRFPLPTRNSLLAAVLVGWLLLAAVAWVGAHTDAKMPPSTLRWPDFSTGVA